MAYHFAEYEPENPAPDMQGAFGSGAGVTFPIQNHRDDAAQTANSDTDNEETGEFEQYDLMAMHPEDMSPDQKFARMKILMERYDIAGALDYALSTLSAGDLSPELYEEVLDLVDCAIAYLEVCGLDAEIQDFKHAFAPHMQFDSPEREDIGYAMTLEHEAGQESLEISSRIAHLNATDPAGSTARPSASWIEEMTHNIEDHLPKPSPGLFGLAA